MNIRYEITYTIEKYSYLKIYIRKDKSILNCIYQNKGAYHEYR
ncbi:hypothetical protein CHRYSEOSP005_10240 [Chryseobacterium sp. Alg-005]